MHMYMYGHTTARAQGLSEWLPVIIIDREYARVQSYGRGNGSGDSPLDVRLSPWTEAGVASDPATHFRVPRNHLIRFVDGFGVAWREAPPLRERLIDAFLEVARSSALGNPRTRATAQSTMC